MQITNHYDSNIYNGDAGTINKTLTAKKGLV